MTNISLRVSTRECIPDKVFLGYEGENEIDKLIFYFKDEFIDGQALLNVQKGEIKGYVTPKKVGETYELPIEKSLVSEVGEVRFQLVITTITGKVAKFEPFVMTVLDAIDTDAEMPEEYPSWIDIANAKLAELEEAIEKAEAMGVEIDDEMSDVSINGVQNKVIKAYVDGLVGDVERLLSEV